MGNYCVYKHTSPSGKVYVGITKLNPMKRWRNGKGYHENSYFWKAISKYGWGAFKHEIVASLLSKEDAAAMEVELIAKYKSNDPEHGYNITAGGEVNILPRSSLDKIREKNKRMVFTEEHRRKISEAKKKLLAEHPEKAATRKGSKISAQQRKLMTDASKKVICKKVECVETGAIYSSMTEACCATGANISSLSETLHGKQKRAAGFTWRYVEAVE